MSGFTLPVHRPHAVGGRALVVGSPTCRALPVEVLATLGYPVAESDDPYAALAELCQPGRGYRALVLSLNNLYREELQIIPVVKRRFPVIEIWLAHTDGRPAALAEAVALGADGFLSDEGLHRHRLPAAVEVPPVAAPTRVEVAAPRPAPLAPPPGSDAGLAVAEASRRKSQDADDAPSQPGAPTGSEPILTADELRALLHEAPTRPSAAIEAP
jgi:hypothetical protein